MEPFGLFNLLKTLLPQTEENTVQNPPQEEKQFSPPQTEPNGNTPQATQPEKENACLSFFEEHDRRAKKTKK